MATVSCVKRPADIHVYLLQPAQPYGPASAGVVGDSVAALTDVVGAADRLMSRPDAGSCVVGKSRWLRYINAAPGRDGCSSDSISCPACIGHLIHLQCPFRTLSSFVCRTGHQRSRPTRVRQRRPGGDVRHRPAAAAVAPPRRLVRFVPGPRRTPHGECPPCSRQALLQLIGGLCRGDVSLRGTASLCHWCGGD